jgi:hypothetical protein
MTRVFSVSPPPAAFFLVDEEAWRRETRLDVLDRYFRDVTKPLQLTQEEAEGEASADPRSIGCLVHPHASTIVP